MHLAGERDRGERRAGQERPAGLQPEQGQWEEERDRAEQMPGALGDAVGREREREATGDRRAAGQPQ